MRPISLRPVLSAALVFAAPLVGCGIEPAPQPEPIPTRAPVTGVSAQGYVWDPEFFLVSVATCPDPNDCPEPYLAVFTPHYLASLVPNAKVVPSVQGEPVSTQETALTGYDGLWQLQDTQVPADKYLNVTAEVVADAPPPAEGEPYPKKWHSGIPTLPTPSYVKTTSLRPVDPRRESCMYVGAAVFSKTGILRAVASHFGIPVADLTDPAKTGGVLIWWNVEDEVYGVIPLYGTSATFDRGEAVSVSWAPPGVLPPEARQSPVGFWADPANDPETNIGLTVLVLPPSEGPTTVTPAIVDHRFSVEEELPMTFPPVAPVTVRPGEISFMDYRASPNALGELVPPELCYPEIDG